MLREQSRPRQPSPGAIVGVSGHARRRAAFLTRRIVFYLLLGYTFCAFVITSDSSKYAYPSEHVSQSPNVSAKVGGLKGSVVHSLVDVGSKTSSNYTNPPAATVTLPFWFMSAHVLYVTPLSLIASQEERLTRHVAGILNWRSIVSSTVS
jgi:hypothetical protein